MTPAQINALVAEKVMGLKREVRIKGTTNYVTIYSDNPYSNDGIYECDVSRHYVQPPCYSTSIADAWQVVEKMQADGYHFIGVCSHDTKQWQAVFFTGANDETGGTMADSMPMAICLAALKAVGVEVEP